MAIRSLAETTRAHPKNEIRPLHIPPQQDEASTIHHRGELPKALFQNWHGPTTHLQTKKLVTAKIAKKSRQERKEDHCYPRNKAFLCVLRELFATFAVKSFVLGTTFSMV